MLGKENEKNSKKCFECGKRTFGIFNRASKLILKLKNKQKSKQSQARIQSNRREDKEEEDQVDEFAEFGLSTNEE